MKTLLKKVSTFSKEKMYLFYKLNYLANHLEKKLSTSKCIAYLYVFVVELGNFLSKNPPDNYSSTVIELQSTNNFFLLRCNVRMSEGY